MAPLLGLPFEPPRPPRPPRPPPRPLSPPKPPRPPPVKEKKEQDQILLCNRAEKRERTSSASTPVTARETSSTPGRSVTAPAVVPRRGKVEPQRSTVKFLTLPCVQRGLGTLDSLELHVGEALGRAGLPVGRQTNGLNVSVLSESVVERVLVGGEGHVADPEGGTGRVLLVAVLRRTFLRVRPFRSLRGVVDVDGSTVDFLAVQRNGLGGRLFVGKLDVTEPSGTVLFTVHHNSDANDLTTLLEFGLQPVVVNVPRERTDKDVLGRLLLLAVVVGLGDSSVLGLSLFGRRRGFLAGLSLAIGDGSINFHLGLLFLVRAVLVGRVLLAAALLSLRMEDQYWLDLPMSLHTLAAAGFSASSSLLSSDESSEDSSSDCRNDKLVAGALDQPDDYSRPSWRQVRSPEQPWKARHPKKTQSQSQIRKKTAASGLARLYRVNRTR